MGRGGKEDAASVPMELRKVIAQNIEHYIPQEIEAKVAEAGGFNPKTITRLRYPASYPTHGVTVGSLVKLSEGLRLARAISIEPWEWLRALRPGPILTGSETRISEKQATNAVSAERDKRQKRGKS